MQEVSGSIPLGSTIRLISPLCDTLADEVSSAGVFRIAVLVLTLIGEVSPIGLFRVMACRCGPKE